MIGSIFLILFVMLFSDSEPTNQDTCSITISITKDHGRIESSNYPKPYPGNCVWTYSIHIEKTHKLKLVIMDLDIDVEAGDTFTIQLPPGNKVEVENHSKQVPITSEITDKENKDSVVIVLVAKDHSNHHKGFALTFERVGEATEKNHDTELPGWIQLYLAGISAFEFTLIQDRFREGLAKITKKYIDMKHLSNEDETMIENDIVINSMVPCPNTWPWSSNCIQLNFSLQLSDNPFELNSDHLLGVWELHRSSEEFYELGISEYELPDLEWFIWFWILIIGFISVVFVFLLIIVIRTRLIHYYFLKLQENRTDPGTRSSNWTAHVPYSFNAENHQRRNFLREYERRITKPPFSRQSGIENSAYDNQSNTTDVRDDYDSENDQHIYHSLNYK